jgi:3-deoxy-D-manno-octulosonate cytidylyltransferase
MRVVALIPARYDSTRFPGKLMVNLAGKTVIRRTYEAVAGTGLFDEVVVVTDSDIIYKEIAESGGSAAMSRPEHVSGSDRIAEAAANMDVDVVVNVQGDEPFTQKKPLEMLLAVFAGPDADRIDVASLMQGMTDAEQINDPNYVKVVVDRNDFALYFSRSPVPYPGYDTGVSYFEHVGVYAFRKQALMDFTEMPRGPAEAAEGIECLRFLEHGKSIKMVETEYMGVEIDTPEDIEAAERLLKQLQMD